MSSACPRASRRRSRYSFRIWSASMRVRSAASIDSAIARLRFSSASWMRGNASLRSRSSVMPNASSVQIIRPTFGVTRKLPSPPPLSVAAKTSPLSLSRLIRLRQEERDQAEDERVEHDRLGQGETEPLDRGDLLAHLGLARHRLDDLAEDEADADAGADRPEAGADAERDGLAGLAPVLLRVGGLGEDVDDLEIHC